jgi:YihY family inner membrane protein
VLAIADDVGAPLFSGALAFNAMFAILPGLMLLSGLLGFAIADEAVRKQLLEDLIAKIPPLAPVFENSLDGVVNERGSLTIIGFVGLLWGASNFYNAIDDVMRRMFTGSKPRDIVEKRLRGILTVVILIILFAGTVLMSGTWTLIVTSVDGLPGASLLLTIGGPVLFSALCVVSVWLTFRLVPTAPPTLREAWLPVLAAGTAIGLLTSLFSVLAPLLVGGLAAFGVLAAVFGAFVWLNLSFQFLLWGAAWARYRRDRFRLSTLTADI